MKKEYHDYGEYLEDAYEEMMLLEERKRAPPESLPPTRVPIWRAQ